MERLSFTTGSGLTYNQEADIICIYNTDKSYSRLGEYDYFGFVDDKVTPEEKVEFENQVTELLKLVENFKADLEV